MLPCAIGTGAANAGPEQQVENGKWQSKRLKKICPLRSWLAGIARLRKQLF